ncbi:MAG: alpha/beta hydrolase [Abitibacteriaceae bacterium]|nr:alpha/beta hydrolase [Abditibacteriaceae bacterium]
MCALIVNLKAIPQNTAQVQPGPTQPSLWQRVGLLATTALLLKGLLLLFVPATPSEHFHILVPCLWITDFCYYQRHTTKPAWGLVVGAACAVFLFMWQLIGWQANALGGRVDWREPLWWLLFLCSLAVLYMLLHAALAWLFELVPAVKDRMDAPGGWWLRLGQKGLAIIIFAPYVFTTCNVHRFKIAGATSPQRAYNYSYETVQFRAAEDNVPLSGWYIPCQKSDTTVLLCHGIGANKGNFLNFVPLLHDAGFNVFIFDFRGHGDSAGHTISFGYYEARDVRGAVAYLCQRHEIKHILAYAFSMGGSALLHAMPNLPMVQGVVVDSTFADITTVLEHQMAFLPLGFNHLMPRLVDFYTRLELGIPLASVAPRRHIAVISPRPLLIIHGRADSLIPFSEAQRNYAAAGEPKQLWLINGANHIEASSIDPDEYQRRVTQFLWGCVHTNKQLH